MGKILSIVEQNGFRISKIKMAKLLPEEVLTLFEERRSDPFIQDTVQYLSEDISVGVEVVRENAIEKLNQVCGPQNSLTAKNQAPNSIRALFGKDSMRNAVHCSDTQ